MDPIKSIMCIQEINEGSRWVDGEGDRMGGGALISGEHVTAEQVIYLILEQWGRAV